MADRWAGKEVGSLCGALSQVTTSVRIAVGATHLTTRHPVTLAGLATTMQMLSEGRFVLGVVRGAGMLRGAGIPIPSTAAIKDYATIMRRLWAGETVSYNGPAGNYDGVRLPDAVKGKEVPLILAAMLDWEMAALGPGEADLAWWIVMDSLLSEGLELPRLAGLPDRSESIEFYERARGRPVEHIDYYEIFAALRFALVLIRATERYRSVGVVAPDTTFGSNSPPMRLLARQLALPIPELSPDIRRLMGRPFDEKTRAATSA